MSVDEDSQLRERLKGDGPGAFRELVDLHRDRVLNICYRFLHSREDAEDVAQDVFIEVHRSLSGFRGESRLSTWLYRIAVTKSLDLIRRRNRRKRFCLFLSPLEMESPVEQVPAPPGSNPDAVLEERERAALLRQAVDSLSENQRIAVTLSKYEGVGQREIAEIMGTTIPAVESLLHRGMENLRNRLRRHFRAGA